MILAGIWTCDLHTGAMRYQHRKNKNSQLTLLPMCGFTAQLEEHGIGIAEVTGSNPVEALSQSFSSIPAPLTLLGSPQHNIFERRGVAQQLLWYTPSRASAKTHFMQQNING